MAMMEERISEIGARLIEIITTEQKRENRFWKKSAYYGGAVNNGGDYASKEAAGIWQIIIPSSQFCCKFKTAFKKIFVWIQFTYNVVLFSDVQQFLYMYLYPLFFKILSSYKSLQSTELNSFCYYSKCLLVFYFRYSSMYMSIIWPNLSLPPKLLLKNSFKFFNYIFKINFKNL